MCNCKEVILIDIRKHENEMIRETGWADKSFKEKVSR